MVKAIPTPSAPSVKAGTKVYDKFRGVDFSADPHEIKDYNSPDALNLISDSGGFPQKRVGWRVLLDFATVAINGIHLYADNHFIIHAGTTIYKWLGEGEAVPLMSGVTNSKSTSVLFNGKLYILTGAEYLVYNGTTCDHVYNSAYIPATSINRKPSGGGANEINPDNESINLLSYQSRNTFVADGVSTEYKLDTENIDSVDSVTFSYGTPSVAYTVNKSEGKVIFNSAVAKSIPEGYANVEIKYTKIIPGQREKITKCTIATIYNNCVFFSGNPDYKNADFYCAWNMPSYISDMSYNVVGNDGSAIMGYLRVGDSLAIVKEDNSQDATIFLRTYQIGDANIIFPIKQGISGAGAISKGVFVHLIDDPLFLSRTGILGIANTLITQEKTLQSRSTKVNAKLTKENLANAIAVEWNGYLVMVIDDRAYIADSRQKAWDQNATNTFEYEWYYWDNIPANCLMETKGSLFFGTTDGKLCRFNTDLLNPDTGEYLMTAYNDNGQAITAYWTTPKSDEGSYMTYKTMTKKGGGVYLKAFTRSSAKVTAITDNDFGKVIKSVSAGIFDFTDLDFSNFTFNTLPQNVIPFNTKIKKYKTIQIEVRNDRLNEGFGLFSIERRFTYGQFVK